MEAIIQNSQCDFVAFGFHSIDPEAVRRVQELERQVLVWTVNETCEIQRAKSIGVDGIISDYPDRI
jgi:glycerophosphoryl diester phosphodiesterase